MIGDLVAKQAVEKEVKLEKQKNKLVSHTEKITIQKIYELKERLEKIKASGKYPVSKIELMTRKLYEMEKKLDLAPADPGTTPTGIPKESLSLEGEPKKEVPVKHKMLFDADQKQTLKEIKPKLDKLEDDIDELPIPPPPRIKKK